MAIEDDVRAELTARGVSAAEVEVLVKTVTALIDIWGDVATKKAAKAGVDAAAKIVTEDDAEAAQRNLL